MASTMIRKGIHGRLKDGRHFRIIDIEKLTIDENGMICSGTIGVSVDGKYDTYRIEDFARNINYMSLPTDTIKY